MGVHPSLRVFSLVSASILLGACAPDVGIKPLPHVMTVGAPGFRQATGSLLGAGFVPGNRIATLQNGEEIFPAMLAAIRSARRTITFETYVFEKGDVPRAFADALSERARAGVKVLAIIDAQGGSKSKKYSGALKDAGVEVARYHPAWHPNWLRYNNRTHRKLLVIDGRVAFIGGVGIADDWAGDANSPEHWRDNHYRLQGPVVAQVQAAFADNWLKTRKEILFGDDYFPALSRAGSALASVFFASPGHGSFGVPVLYHTAIASAAKSVLIQNAYFVPDRDTISALSAAARRGVRVQIILPGEHIDQQKVRRASRKRWQPLLEAGVGIYEYQPRMIHSKLLVVDGRFVSVGSANFDNRSLHLNDEANLNVLDVAFAAEQTRLFQADLAKCRRMTLENYRDVPITERVMEILQSPIEGQL
jgi:cardiolipin synthase A/B